MIDKKYLKPGVVLGVYREHAHLINSYKANIVEVKDDLVLVYTPSVGKVWCPIDWFYLQANEEHKQDIQELKDRIKYLEQELKKQTRDYKDLVTAAKMISCELEYLNLD